MNIKFNQTNHIIYQPLSKILYKICFEDVVIFKCVVHVLYQLSCLKIT